MNITGSTIVITGAARGLGRAMALALADKGASLALIDLDADAAESTARDCQSRGGQATAFTANIASEADVVEVFAAIKERFGGIHGLINNAGILRDGLLVKARDGNVIKRMSLDEWQSVIDVNLTGVFLCGREAATHMIEGGQGGVIINISSISRAGNAGQSNYSAAKAAVAALSVTWAKELARFGIRSASISPGFTDTEMVASMKPEARQRIETMVPLGRLARPDEMASTAVFIFENDYVSGRSFDIDGGLRL
ncbi:MAG: SDR family oxidoreductase [Xanthomonadales bacterium]|nr:SDR family oxidoreductase [Xanthomonadales bacterium]